MKFVALVPLACWLNKRKQPAVVMSWVVVYRRKMELNSVKFAAVVLLYSAFSWKCDS